MTLPNTDKYQSIEHSSAESKIEETSESGAGVELQDHSDEGTENINCLASNLNESKLPDCRDVEISPAKERRDPEELRSGKPIPECALRKVATPCRQPSQYSIRNRSAHKETLERLEKIKTRRLQLRNANSETTGIQNASRPSKIEVNHEQDSLPTKRNKPPKPDTQEGRQHQRSNTRTSSTNKRRKKKRSVKKEQHQQENVIANKTAFDPTSWMVSLFQCGYESDVI